jgi:LytS/YehU family sensor histidine kinase
VAGINPFQDLKNASDSAFSVPFIHQSRAGRFVPVLLDLLFFLGPSLVLAVHMSVESYSDLLISGAASRYRMLWVIGVALVYKYCLIEGLSRYTLAQGEDIFMGLRHIPGPQNWDIIFIMSIYTLELLGFGGIAFFAGTFLVQLFPALYSVKLMAILSLILAGLFLYKCPYSFFEKLVSLFAGLILLGTFYTLIGTKIPFVNLSQGFAPVIEKEQLITVMGLLGAVGSSLSLLFYSTWLKEKIGARHGEAYFSRHFRNVRLSQGLAFWLTGIFSFAFMTIGLSSGSSTDFFNGIYLSLHKLPYGVPVFILTSYVIFIALILTGIDGRARAIASILRGTGISFRDETTLYRGIISGLVIILAFIISFGEPGSILTWVSALASIMFAFIGFMVVYLDFKLPAYARGSKLWRFLMVAGSFLFLLVALLKEEQLLLFGVPLMERVTVVAFVIYLFSSSKNMRLALERGFSMADRALIVIVFGTLSIYGTTQAIFLDGAYINFRDLGPMLAGLIGGPILGGLAGLIGGLYRYSLGGWTALPCAVATILAGVLAGYAAICWKGRLDYLRLTGLGVLVEAIHLLVIFPLLVYPAPLEDVFDLIRSFLLPMTFTNVFGLALFLYILKEQSFFLENRFVSRLQEIGGLKVSLQTLTVLISVLALLILEGSFMTTGIQLIERFVVVAFFLYVLSGTVMIKNSLKRGLSLKEQSLMALDFGFLSIYGTLQAVRIGEILVNFRDLGPMLAGLLCGPFAGAAAGFMGGSVRYMQGGWTALPCAVASVAAGLLAGVFSKKWQKKFSYIRFVFLGVFIESIHLFVLFPLLTYPAPLSDILEVVRSSYLPMTVINVLGLLFFLYVIKELNSVEIGNLKPEGEVNAEKTETSVLIKPLAVSVLLFLAAANDGYLLNVAVPLLERVLVVAFSLYLLSRTETLHEAVAGRPFGSSRIWLVMSFGLLSVYGTMRAVPVDGILVNFRDMGPMLAGLLGGPLIGGLTGLIGGIYRLSQGGWTAVPCAVATIAAGFVAGGFSIFWKRKLNYIKVIFLGVLVECLHLLVIFPLLVYPAPLEDITSVIRNSLPSMLLVNVFGLVLFMYILREQELDP